MHNMILYKSRFDYGAIEDVLINAIDELSFISQSFKNRVKSHFPWVCWVSNNQYPRDLSARQYCSAAEY